MRHNRRGSRAISAVAPPTCANTIGLALACSYIPLLWWIALGQTSHLEWSGVAPSRLDMRPRGSYVSFEAERTKIGFWAGMVGSVGYLGAVVSTATSETSGLLDYAPFAPPHPGTSRSEWHDSSGFRVRVSLPKLSALLLDEGRIPC